MLKIKTIEDVGWVYNSSKNNKEGCFEKGQNNLLHIVDNNKTFITITDSNYIPIFRGRCNSKEDFLQITSILGI